MDSTTTSRPSRAECWASFNDLLMQGLKEALEEHPEKREGLTAEVIEYAYWRAENPQLPAVLEHQKVHGKIPNEFGSLAAWEAAQ